MAKPIIQPKRRNIGGNPSGMSRTKSQHQNSSIRPLRLVRSLSCHISATYHYIVDEADPVFAIVLFPIPLSPYKETNQYKYNRER